MNNNGYNEFLEEKTIRFKQTGINIDRSIIHSMLFEWQKDLVVYNARKGKSALFADTGLGKTIMYTEWSRVIDGDTLVVSPPSVIGQSILEAQKVRVEMIHSDNGKEGPLTITSYGMLDHFNPNDFDKVVLDESSILKSITSKTREKLIKMFANTSYKLCCTATPAPNDIAEIANHSHFLGIMTRAEMLSAFFVHDQNGWRLKGHSKEHFYRWLASWGMSVKKPSDLGYSNEGFDLPELIIEPHFVEANYVPKGQLFFTGLRGISDRSRVRRGTIDVRVNAVAEIVNDSNEQWLVWCGLNDESKMVSKLVQDAIEVKGADKFEFKQQAFRDFQNGKIRVLVTKPKIAGFGMNFQNSHNMIFVGLSDSWESYYQCIRRQYRFGQLYPVKAIIVLSDIEDGIYKNVIEKEKVAKEMSDHLIKNVKQYEKEEIEGVIGDSENYTEDEYSGHNWKLLLGDSVKRLSELENDSIDLSVFSPPFASLYTYSPSARDLGNSTDEQFLEHFRFIAEELFRVTKPGRVAACHVMDLPATYIGYGYIGIRDFSGEVIKVFIDAGWIYDGRTPIDKNQQAQSIRTHSKGLTMTQMKKDRSWLRTALPDYILKLRKPGDNEIPVKDGMSGDEWIELANPIWPGENGDRCADVGPVASWYGIRENDVVKKYQKAKGKNDEKHVCPLQLPTINRCIRLWSNENELVLDPFAGIGSTGHEALRLDRRFIGIELKPEYAKVAVKNLEVATADKLDLFQQNQIKIESVTPVKIKKAEKSETLSEFWSKQKEDVNNE